MRLDRRRSWKLSARRRPVVQRLLNRGTSIVKVGDRSDSVRDGPSRASGCAIARVDRVAKGLLGRLALGLPQLTL